MPSPQEMQMIAYYMSTLGQGLMAEDHPMQPVAKATQQQISTQNYMNMIKQMLAGGGKFSADKDKFKIDAPSALLGEDFYGAGAGAGAPGFSSNVAVNAPGTQRTSGAPQQNMMSNALNFSASPLDISGAGLVGLTPENISQALQLKFMGEEVEQKKVSDIQDMMFKVATLEATDTRSADVKNYEYARSQGFEGSFTDFKNVAETTHKKDYEEAMGGGYVGSFNDWMLEMAKAGAINLGEIAEREVGKGFGKGQADVMSPDYAQNVREDLMKDKANWPAEGLIKQYTDKGLPYTEAEERAQKMMVLQEMDKRIRQAFKGKKVTTEDDGWHVDGKLKVRYP